MSESVGIFNKVSYLWTMVCALTTLALASVKFAFSSKWKLVDTRMQAIDTRLTQHIETEDKDIASIKVQLAETNKMILDIWKRFAKEDT